MDCNPGLLSSMSSPALGCGEVGGEPAGWAVGPQHLLQVEGGKTTLGENFVTRPPVKGDWEACSPERQSNFLKVTWHPGAEGFLIPSPVLLLVHWARATEMSAINNKKSNNNHS